MRKSMLLGVGAALAVAGGAVAQTGPGAPYPAPGRHVVPGPGVYHPPLPQPPMRTPQAGPSRWGSQVDGRWWGGANAPGGWAAYRQPYRGYRLPGYWVSPRFTIADWQLYGMPQPWAGYRWVRYYDDAVLIDRGGQVGDWRGDVSWDGADYAGEDRRGDGVGGAVAGAVVGGVAGNVIAGRGNRLGGTLVGAGVGAAAGYAIDRAADRDRRGPPPPPVHDRRDYRGAPMASDLPPPPPPPMVREHHRDVVTYDDARMVPPPPMPEPGGPDIYRERVRGADGRTTVTTTTTTGGYAGGYGYPPPPVIVTPGPAYGYGYGGGYGGLVTTVTIQTQPVVTTTTTEIIEDSVTYTSRPVVRRAARHRVWHARPRPRPRCICR